MDNNEVKKPARIAQFIEAHAFVIPASIMVVGAVALAYGVGHMHGTDWMLKTIREDPEGYIQ